MASTDHDTAIDRFIRAPGGGPLVVEPALGAVAAQADDADRTRTIDPSAYAALKATGVADLAAAPEIGGRGGTVDGIGRELAAVAAACTSTAWVLWNHLSVFHLVAGCLGPDHRTFLTETVAAVDTVCFPAGASSAVRGTIDGDAVTLTGKGAFGSGCRYADWAGVAFLVIDGDGNRVEPLDLRFTVVGLDAPGVTIAETWDGSAVRASATDDVHYDGVTVPLDRCVQWFGANRAEALREVPVVAHRYREDWVGLSDLWLGWMGVGLVGAVVADAVAETAGRRAILGREMSSHPAVQLNLGDAAVAVAAAAATLESACREVDDRIAACRAPTEADYLRQMGLAAAALDQLGRAMELLRRTLGGNGLRESRRFDRAWRDFQAMPVHINAHRDRVNLRVGRFALGEEQDPF